MNHPDKIILVEDDPLDAELTTLFLRSVPLLNEIVWLETGQDLIQYLDQHGTEEITLVIMDLKMPVMSGLEALKVIKHGDKPYPYFPIVILTSSQELPEVRECYALGVNAFVTKPVGQEEFRDAVRSLGLFWGLINVRP